MWRKQRAEGRTVYEPFETRKVFEECEWYLVRACAPRCPPGQHTARCSSWAAATRHPPRCVRRRLTHPSVAAQGRAFTPAAIALPLPVSTCAPLGGVGCCLLRVQEDGSGLRVKVENALQADRLRSAMEVKSEFVGEDLSKATLGKVLMEKAW